MSIESLVHSNPTSPSLNTPAPAAEKLQASTQGSFSSPDGRHRRPAIEKYFAIPPSLAMQGRKRRRSEVDRSDEIRRVQNQIFS